VSQHLTRIHLAPFWTLISVEQADAGDHGIKRRSLEEIGDIV